MMIPPVVKSFSVALAFVCVVTVDWRLSAQLRFGS
jgi:hypothetical protein